MLKNYFKTGFRSLWRAKTFTLINVSGLALGIAVFLLIFQYVAFEWSANRFHQSFDKMYRISVVNKSGEPSTYLPPGLSPLIKEKVPGIESSIRVADGIGGGVISYNEKADGDTKAFREEQMLYVDSDFLQSFTFPLVDGTPSLKQPATMAISESFAKKLFGSVKAAGKRVLLSDQFGNTPYMVASVFQDMPANSDIKTNVLLSLHTLESKATRNENDWADPATLESGYSSIYVVLKNGVKPATVAKDIAAVFRSAREDAKDVLMALQPMSQLHLAPSFDYSFQTFGSLKLVVMLLSVALLILCIAWINYINLTTVQALKRAKETGVRKVLGASAGQLRLQYLSETLLLTLVSVVLALVLVSVFQNLFNDFTGKPLSLGVLNQGWFWAAAAGLLLMGSLLSGGYVAFVLSSYQPMATLRGKLQGIGKGLFLRKGLVVFQFTISIVFMIATVVLYKQLQYMKSGGSGVNLNQLLVIKGPTVSSDGQAERNVAFKNAMVQLPFVKQFAASNNVPGRGYNFSTEGITRLAPQKGDEKKQYEMFICDNNYFSTYGIGLTEGRVFTQNEAYEGWNKAKKILVNERAASQLGFAPGEPVAGKKILWGSEFEILGVVKDYNHLALQKAIEPMIFLPSVSFVYFTIQTPENGMRAKLTTINNLYKQYFPGNPFEYFFADETFNKQYSAERKLGSIFSASALVALLIACLGLFGLAAFTARQRIKEIGIRKVLGASVGSIAQLLSKDFLALVLLSIGIAAPLAWWGLNKWLEDFAYRTTISWWVFVLASLAAIAIALATVSYQAIKAARMNPVKNLRAE